MAAERSKAHAGEVPVELTSFVGREEHLREALAMLEDAPLLTMVGPGGVGKTRLALRMVQALRKIDPRVTVCWTTLSALERAALPTSSTSVERQVAESLGVEIVSEDSLWDLLVDHLREQVAINSSSWTGYLLVLDNCEHVVEPLGALVSGLLAAVDGIRVLATSREPIGCGGEHIYTVPSLSYPRSSGSEVAQAVDISYESVALLVERAKAAGFTISEHDRAAAALLCQRLDGIPLAIELAAAGLRTLSLAEIVSRLAGGSQDTRFRMLAGGPRHGAHPMHHSLRAAVDWSYQLCSPPEQILWARISVFEDGWDLAAAEAVCAGNGVDREDILDLLGKLVGKSVVVADTRSRQTRYSLLETLRQYGHDLAVERDELDTLRRAHRDHYLSLASRAAEEWFSARELELLNWARIELPNLRAALEWSLTSPGEETAGLEMAASLARLRIQFFLGISGQALEWLEVGLVRTAAERPTELRAWAMSLAGYMALCAGGVSTARRLLVECRAEAATLESAPLQSLEGLYAFFAEGSPRSVAIFTQALKAFDGLEGRFEGERHMALLFKAMAAAWYADQDEALTITHQCLEDAKSVGAEWAISWATMVRGLASIWHGDPRDIMKMERRQREIGDHWGMMYSTHMAAWALAEILGARRGTDARRDRDDATHIARVLGGAQRLRARYRVMVAELVPFQDANTKAEDLARSILGTANYSVAFAEGSELSYEEILTLAFNGSGSPAKASRTGQSRAKQVAWNALTHTEKQVAVLVAQGLTDAQIARRRICSVRTVEKHVEHIRNKLLVDSRSEVARWAPPAEET